MEPKLIKPYFETEEQVKAYTEYNPNHWRDKQYLEILKSIGSNKKVLCLGCGSGREVKQLVSQGNEVVGIDYSEPMIKKAKEIEPNAEYHCIDARTYLNNIVAKNIKFDYVLGLFSLFNYIPNSDRDMFLYRCWHCLNPGGEVIFSVIKVWNDWKTIIKSLIALFYSIRYLDFDYEFGDVYNRLNTEPYMSSELVDMFSKEKKRKWICTHTYTNNQLRKLFAKNWDLTIDGEIIKAKKIDINWFHPSAIIVTNEKVIEKEKAKQDRRYKKYLKKLEYEKRMEATSRMIQEG